jgi:hypothetical protein
VSADQIEEARAEAEQEFRLRQLSKSNGWTESLIEQQTQLLAGTKEHHITIIDAPGGLQTNTETDPTNIDRDRPEVNNLLSHRNLQGVFILGKSVEELKEWANLVYRINQKRSELGLSPLLILGDYVTSTSSDGIAVADSPKKEGATGQIDAITRDLSLMDGNSTVTLLALLMVNLGLKE